MSDRALVLLSGGQDSALCLAWALDRFPQVETIGFDYGQRHRVEMACRLTLRTKLAAAFPQWGERLGQDHVIDLTALGHLTDTALTRAGQAITERPDGLLTSFVPGRNILFFSYAAILATQHHIRHLVGGMCETDYSGYPDCRDDSLKALQVALNLGMAQRFVLHTPLMWLDKAASWRLAARLGGADLVALLVEETHSCYEGDRTRRHDWGYGCGSCPACRLRAEGFRTAMQSDP